MRRAFQEAGARTTLSSVLVSGDHVEGRERLQESLDCRFLFPLYAVRPNFEFQGGGIENKMKTKQKTRKLYYCHSLKTQRGFGMPVCLSANLFNPPPQKLRTLRVGVGRMTNYRSLPFSFMPASSHPRPFTPPTSSLSQCYVSYPRAALDGAG